MTEHEHKSPLAVLFAVVVFAAVLGLAAGVAALIYANRVEKLTEQVADIAAENTKLREQADIAVCIDHNVDALHARNAAREQILALVPKGTVLTAEQKARIDASAAAVATQQPYRDCSPAGIDAYLADPPPDPADPP